MQTTIAEQKEQPKITQDDANYYQKLKQEYAQIFKIFIELEDERKEHVLVLDAIKNLEPERRCWRMVGGVLIERNVGEVMPALKQNIELLEKATNQYQENLNKKEKELFDFELKHGLKTQKQQSEETQETQNEQGKVTGVLA